MNMLAKLNLTIDSASKLDDEMLSKALLECIVGNIKTDKQLAEYLNISREQAFLILNNPTFSDIIIEHTINAQKRKFVMQKLQTLNTLTKNSDGKVALGALKLMAEITGIIKSKQDINVTVNLESVLETIEQKKKEQIIDITPSKDMLDEAFNL